MSETEVNATIANNTILRGVLLPGGIPAFGNFGVAVCVDDADAVTKVDVEEDVGMGVDVAV